MIEIFTDGGSRGNPGQAAYGVYILKNKEPIAGFGKRIGFATNNIAEYSGAVAALTWLLEHKDILNSNEDIFFYADSQLLVSQLTGVYKVKNAALREMLFKIRTLEAQIPARTYYRHIRREQNKEADTFVNLALDNKLQVA